MQAFVDNCGRFVGTYVECTMPGYSGGLIIVGKLVLYSLLAVILAAVSVPISVDLGYPLQPWVMKDHFDFHQPGRRPF